MSLNIKNEEVVRLAEWICERTGETKTEAIRVSLEQRAATLGRETSEQRLESIQNFVRELNLTRYDKPGQPLTQEEQDEILGYGEHGV